MGCFAGTARRALCASLVWALSTLGAGEARADMPGPNDPLAGFAGDQAFLRSGNNFFILFPGAQLQIDGYGYPGLRDPSLSFAFRHARLELHGWIGPMMYFDFMVDFARGASEPGLVQSQDFLTDTDDYIAFAPSDGDEFVLQVGQFDAPYTMENRTRDSYTDFLERSLAVRGFGVPGGKARGVMAHGAVFKPLFRYAVAALNAADGQDLDNLGDHLDIVGRLALRPFDVIDVLRFFSTVSFGFSVWGGVRGNHGPRAPRLTTGGGVSLFQPTWRLPGGQVAELQERDSFVAAAVEVNLPIAHRFALRWESLWKGQDLDVRRVDGPGAPLLAGAHLAGWAHSVQGSAWIIGNDRILPEPGVQDPVRLTAVRSEKAQHGWMVALRWNHLDRGLSTELAPHPGSPSGGTHINGGELAMNYWYSRRLRVTADYALYHLDGTAGGVARVRARNNGSAFEHEIGFRVGASL